MKKKQQKKKPENFSKHLSYIFFCEYFPDYDMQNDCNNTYINQTEDLIREVKRERVLLIS